MNTIVKYGMIVCALVAALGSSTAVAPSPQAEAKAEARAALVKKTPPAKNVMVRSHAKMKARSIAKVKSMRRTATIKWTAKPMKPKG